jgi:5-methylcytosine-specific restriction endonuclease McrA
VTPVSAERYLLHVPIDRATHDKLKHAVALLGHAIPSGDVAQVLDRALDTLVKTLERRKCARTDRPARGGRPRPRGSRTASSRHVPAHVRRAVWERDRGQCTFVGDTGHRCGASTRLEFDHVDPVARGGRATVETIRLRCRAHNQVEAERVFGAGFMRAKRAEARERATRERAARERAAGERATSERAATERAAGERAATEQAARESAAAARAQAADTALASRRRDVCAALRSLGFRADEVRRGLAASECAPCATLEAQVSAALRRLGSEVRRQPQAVPWSAASPRPGLRSESAARP